MKIIFENKLKSWQKRKKKCIIVRGIIDEQGLGWETRQAEHFRPDGLNQGFIQTFWFGVAKSLGRVKFFQNFYKKLNQNLIKFYLHFN